MFSYHGRVRIGGVVYEDGTEALERMGDYNCLHFYVPVILGVSEPTWDSKELARMKAEDTKLIEYDGVKHTKYEWQQKQRQIERLVRKEKRQNIAYKAYGNEQAAKDTAKNIRIYRSKYDDLCEKVGLQPTVERMRVSGYGRKPLTNGGSGGIINTKELFRAKSSFNRAEFKAVNQKTFDNLTIEAKKNGANIIKCNYGDEMFLHLEKNNATAACIGDTLIFRPDATVSEVLEETYHFKQNLLGTNNDKSIKLRSILNEIEAKQFILDNSKKFSIPRIEIEETQAELLQYQKELENFLKKG